MDIQAKRVYAPFEQEDGVRILVDRVWPRGVSKEKLHADEWLKEVAPSTQLRKWFNHDRSRWDEFKQRYFAELDAKPQVTDRILKRAPEERLTLLFGARDTECNQAVALKEYLMSRKG